MGKTSKKQLLKVITTLVDNLPEEEVENFDPKIAQAIIDGRQTSGSEFARFLKNSARILISNHIIDCSADPFIPSMWSLQRHREDGNFVWNPKKVKLYFSENQKKNKVIDGRELFSELIDQSVLNANVLDYLLARQELIPEEWKGKRIFFWGTIYCNRNGSYVVRCLEWDGHSWFWNYYKVYGKWIEYDFAVVSISN